MITQPSPLADKVAIVTGAARGIGAAIAQRLAHGGATVILADRDLETVEQTAAEVLTPRGPAAAAFVNVADPPTIRSLVEQVHQAHGRLDILVNNAGVMFRTRFPDISLEQWNTSLSVNLTGPFLCSQAVLPLMKDSGTGRIVNIASSAGRSVSTLGGTHYTASKAGLLGLTRGMAKEVAALGITVNAVCPGLIDTEMARATTTREELRGFIESFPAKRLGRPAEVGDLVSFLCSDQAAYITGASFDINGGDLMM